MTRPMQHVLNCHKRALCSGQNIGPVFGNSETAKNAPRTHHINIVHAPACLETLYICVVYGNKGAIGQCEWLLKVAKGVDRSSSAILDAPSPRIGGGVVNVIVKPGLPSHINVSTLIQATCRSACQRVPPRVNA